MMTALNKNIPDEMRELTSSVRALVKEEAYDKALEIIRLSMQIYPHSPEPHNLMGIVLERLEDHNTAMKHFRAAWALDPTYLPASHNLTIYGTFFGNGACAFDESDLTPPPKSEEKMNGKGK